MKKVFLVSIENATISIRRSDGEMLALSVAFDSDNFSTIGDSISVGLKQLGHRNEKLVLGLGSSHVFFVNTDFDKNTVSSSTATRFALEEVLPFDAEQMSALIVGSVARQSAIVLRCSVVQDLLNYLNEEHAVSFDSIIPNSLILTDYLRREKLMPENCSLLIAEESTTEVLVFDNDRLVGWRYSRGHLDSSHHTIQELAEAESIFCLTDLNDIEKISLSADSINYLRMASREGLANAIRAMEKTGVESQYNFSDRLNADFGIGRPRSSPWELVCFSLLICILCFTATFGYRAYSWRQETARLDQAVDQDFRDLLPGQRINGPVERLLESELAKQRLSNQLIEFSNGSAELLSNLDGFLASLPSDLKFRFQIINVFRDAVDIHGEVKTLADLDRLKNAFTAFGYEIDTGRSTYASKFNLFIERTGTIDVEIGVVTQ